MAEQTYNEALFDGMLRHQVGLLRFSGSLRNRIWKLLDATEADLKKQVRRHAGRAGFESPARVRRMNKLLEGLRESRVTAWRDVRKLWLQELHSLARIEPGFYASVISAAVPVELGSIIPDAAVLRNIVTSQPFDGKTVRQWADNIQAADLSRIESKVKVGLVQGESPRQISRRIVGTASLKGRDGVTQITRRNAEGITRTLVSGVGSAARAKYAELNKEIAPQEVFIATLDHRTTAVCRGFDGKIFNVGEGPVLPLHFGERSLYSGVIDGVVVGDRPRRDFTQRQLLREYAKRENLGAVPRRRADLPRGTKGSFDDFARVRMRELTGTTPAKTTYGEWLRRQSVANQNDILGVTKARLFRNGDLPLNKFVAFDGTELTLSELASRHPNAFELAGLDAADF